MLLINNYHCHSILFSSLLYAQAFDSLLMLSSYLLHSLSSLKSSVSITFLGLFVCVCVCERKFMSLAMMSARLCNKCIKTECNGIHATMACKNRSFMSPTVQFELDLLLFYMHVCVHHPSKTFIFHINRYTHLTQCHLNGWCSCVWFWQLYTYKIRIVWPLCTTHDVIWIYLTIHSNHVSVTMSRIEFWTTIYIAKSLLVGK